MSIRADIGHRIQHRRLRMGLSLFALARELRVDAVVLAQVEAGTYTASPEFIARIANTMGVCLNAVTAIPPAQVRRAYAQTLVKDLDADQTAMFARLIQSAKADVAVNRLDDCAIAA